MYSLNVTKGKFKCKWSIRDISLMISRPCLVISLSASLCGLELLMTSLHCVRWWASCLWSVWAGSIAVRHWYLSDLLCQYSWMIHQLKTHALTHALARTYSDHMYAITETLYMDSLFTRSPRVCCRSPGHKKQKIDTTAQTHMCEETLRYKWNLELSPCCRLPLQLPFDLRVQVIRPPTNFSHTF